MLSSVIKISSCFVVLMSCFVLFFAYFVNTFYVNEEILNIPILEPSKSPKKLLPKNKDQIKKELSFRILDGEKITQDKKRLILKKNNPELVPFDLDKKNNKDKNFNAKKLDIIAKNNNNNSDKSKKQKSTKDQEKFVNLKKYRAQLASFKHKENAKKYIKNIKIKHSKIFENHDLEIKSFKKQDQLYHRVWTKLMLKKDALKFMETLKKVKVNCVLHIDKG